MTMYPDYFPIIYVDPRYGSDPYVLQIVGLVALESGAEVSPVRNTGIKACYDVRPTEALVLSITAI